MHQLKAVASLLLLGLSAAIPLPGDKVLARRVVERSPALTDGSVTWAKRDDTHDWTKRGHEWAKGHIAADATTDGQDWSKRGTEWAKGHIAADATTDGQDLTKRDDGQDGSEWGKRDGTDWLKPTDEKEWAVAGSAWDN